MFADIVRYEFLRNAFIIGNILGIILPLVGIVVLFRKMTPIVDTIGHVNMSAISFAYFVNYFVAITVTESTILVLLWTISGACLIEYLRSKYKNYKEVAIMFIYSLAISLTMIFMSLSSGFQSSLFNILFGNINMITSNEAVFSSIAAIIIIITLYFNYRKMILISLDEESAKIFGINVNFQKYLLTILIALTITIAIRILGILLVSSLVLIPNLAAIRVSNSLKKTVIMGVVFTEIAVNIGLFLGYELNISSSAIIVLVAIVIYLITFLAPQND